jgi:hypothetical protein
MSTALISDVTGQGFENENFLGKGTQILSGMIVNDLA